jgi:hypothetical protein
MKELFFTIKSGIVFRYLGCDSDEVWLFFARDSTTKPEFVLELLGVRKYFLCSEAMDQSCTLWCGPPGSFAWVGMGGHEPRSP